MDVKFVVNDYVLIWNLLFQASISESIYQLKQKLWVNYKDEYNNTYRDKNAILKDPKNFIPNDDTIYNIVLETKDYISLKREAEKYRMTLMKLWDSNKKKIERLVKRVLKINLKHYTFLVVNEELNVIDISAHDQEDGYIIVGEKIDKKDPQKTIIKIILELVKHEVRNKETKNIEIRKALIDLAVLNEFATDIYGRSCYISGDPSRNQLIRHLYPYWLMYLGVPKDEFETFMSRDKIPFNKDQYAYEKELKKMSLGDMIDFCIRNSKYIIRTEKVELI